MSGSLTVDESEVTDWNEAVLYLLQRYAVSNSIREAIPTLMDVTLKPGEKEVEYWSKLNKDAARCANVHTTDEKMTLYVDGLDPKIESFVGL